MSEIGCGIDVYYSNDKSKRNIVFLPDGKYAYYDDGGMLFELINDDAMTMLSDKVESMIRLFPDAREPVSIDGVSNGFKWLYATINDEDRPVATELFRSTFNDSIHAIAAEPAPEEGYDNIGAFLLRCYEYYLDHLKTFCLYSYAVSADVSGVADDFQKAAAEDFYAHAENMFEQYEKQCRTRRRRVDDDREIIVVDMHQISSFLQLLVFEYCRMKKMGKIVRVCANCGCFFIPRGRADTIYCHCPAPGHPGKTCRDVGAQIRRASKRRSNQEERLHHNTSCRLYNNIRRSKEKGDSTDQIAYYKQRLTEEYQRHEDAKRNGSQP